MAWIEENMQVMINVYLKMVLNDIIVSLNEDFEDLCGWTVEEFSKHTS